MPWLAGFALLLWACASPAPSSSRGPEPGRGPPYPMLEPDPALESLAAEFRGSCAFARPPGEAAKYRQRLRVAQGVRVHASANLEGETGAMGRLEPGVRVAAEGPLSMGQGAEAGYALLLRDPEGLVCRGYVEAGALARPGPGPGASTR